MPHYLPEEFYIRLEGRRWGDIDEPALPDFKGYKMKALVQYNHQRKHFRCLRFAGPNTHRLDGQEVEGYKTWEDMWHLIHQSGWSPYIVAYGLKDAAKTPEFLETTFKCSSYGSLSWNVPLGYLTGGSGNGSDGKETSELLKKRMNFAEEIRRAGREEIKETARQRMQIFLLQQ